MISCDNNLKIFSKLK